MPERLELWERLFIVLMGLLLVGSVWFVVVPRLAARLLRNYAT